MRFQIAASLPRTAYALRPMRIDRRDDAIHYEAITFPRDPFQGCELQIRRMEAFGMLTKREQGPLQGTWFLDVLDEQGDILDTLEVNAQGVKYMRRTIGVKRQDASLLRKFDALAAQAERERGE